MKSLFTKRAVCHFKSFTLAVASFSLLPLFQVVSTVIVFPYDTTGARGEPVQRPAERSAAEPGRVLENIPGPSSRSRKSRWPGRQRLLPMQLATFEINPFCIMQRMPPLPRDQSLPRSGLHSAPAPFPGRTQPPSRSGRGPPPLKGRWPALKGPSPRRTGKRGGPHPRRGPPSRAEPPRRPARPGPSRPPRRRRRRERHFYSGDA